MLNLLTNQGPYLKLNALKAEEYKNLPTGKFSIYQVERRTSPGLYYYTLQLKITESITFDFNITQADFFLLAVSHQLPMGLKYHRDIPCYYRIVSSKRDDGSTYMFVEALFNKGLYRSSFFSESQMALAEVLPDKIAVHFYDRLKSDVLIPVYGQQAGTETEAEDKKK